MENSKMDWLKLLSARRLGRLDIPVDVGGPRSPYQRDYDRILFSAAFRRLQDKTQVFPLARNDYVRTRLTHSLEVSTVGRSLGVMVGAKLVERHPELAERLAASDFGTVVAAACLAHDIGNPPFGHAGEDAIQDWFTKSVPGSRYLQDKGLPSQVQADFQRFEGNAQGFRILTRLQFPSQPGGMQLTAAVLGAFTKYPRASVVSRDAAQGISGKKFGFVQQDQPLFEDVAKELCLIQKGNECAWFRHPLAFLVEAADDICYRIMDVEDGFRVGHLTYLQIEHLFTSVLDGPARDKLQELTSDKQKVEYLRAKAINVGIEQVVDAFLENESQLLDGSFDDELLAIVNSAKEFRAFKDLARKHVYSARPVVEIEACGFRVIGGLLESFLPSVDEAAHLGTKMSPRSRTLMGLMPEGSWKHGMNFEERLLSVTDCVSGMTDSYALSTYQRLYGISL